MSDEQDVLDKMDKAAALMTAKDLAIIDELWSDGFRLVGSEESEMAATRDEVVTLITKIFSFPFQLRWAWDSRDVKIENDIAWVFANGRLLFDPPPPGFPPYVPYRLVVIFRRDGSDWVWRLYSGSEPVPDRV